ncbi:acetyltransferase (GNAT) family protein [Rhodopseudomonas faecalis]|uniref:Acetyltransferase (GNAT) family protein n=1 Tax=Rhodopseudomonas faecalis TaxID=99655 RepID=A0A318TAG8_9BRAD|nr:GNAT family N-acetyltransferase [Rhodopseudomonas faecalis]PYF02112.1 acetyltransferase (GNAT) family protein [Rhodopseudomonas faecalis]
MTDLRDLRFVPLSAASWPLLEDLFGPERGADSGCWCMWWRVSRSRFNAMGKDARKAALHRLADSAQPLGILAIHDDQAVGWCAVAPRSAYPVLMRSRVAAPLPDQLVETCWFISCLYVRVGFRRHGLTAHLIKAAVDYALACGASCVEACPNEAATSSSEGFVGTPATFAKLGFVEVARRSPTRPLMRWMKSNRRGQTKHQG